MIQLAKSILKLLSYKCSTVYYTADNILFYLNIYIFINLYL